ncbi:MAG: hypothetical protein PHD97_04930 [Bacteroidales bacterium]|nr:hypothetical protein [Bacteroidales bacterium]
MTEELDIIGEPQKIIIKRIINSGVLFALSFISINIILNIVNAVTGNFYNLSPILYFSFVKYTNKIVFNNHSIFFNYLSGPFICLIIAILSFRIFNVIKRTGGLFKVFFLWLGINGYVLFFGQFAITLVLPNRHVDSIFNFFNMGLTYEVISIIISVLCIAALGINITKYFMYLSHTRYYIKHSSTRREFTLQTCIYSWLWGGVLCFLFYIPFNNFFIIIMLIFNGVVVSVVYLFSKNKRNKSVHISKNTSISKISIKPILILIILWLVFHFTFRLLFKDGIAI